MYLCLEYCFGQPVCMVLLNIANYLQKIKKKKIKKKKQKKKKQNKKKNKQNQPTKINKTKAKTKPTYGDDGE